ncbi:hypothetical protein GCM10010532_100150 [Dactylosporangium siamense]|uniref:Uncharacterized protein n=1 Tax=Dactylosporangium siamense TaxID=685454 RepID=A0A919PW80_9ACTN|nr:hypothetical protein Dsi01nite_094530 [Dactylosporangium siamense]
MAIGRCLDKARRVPFVDLAAKCHAPWCQAGTGDFPAAVEQSCAQQGTRRSGGKRKPILRKTKQEYLTGMESVMYAFTDIDGLVVEILENGFGW